GELEDDQIDELILKLRQRALEARAAPPTLLASSAKVSDEPLEARKDAAVFLREVYQRAEDALGRARDDAAMLAGLLGDPRASRQHRTLPDRARPFVPVERPQGPPGAPAVGSLAHKVGPSPLPPLVLAEELLRLLGRSLARVEERAR